MKRVRIVVTVLLLVFTGFVWFKSIMTTVSTVNSYELHVKNGNEFCNEKLYQKAIIEYEAALDIKENIDLRIQLISTYQLSYEAGFSTEKEYTKALRTACEVDNHNVTYWKQLMQLYVDSGYYSKAYDTYKDAIEIVGDADFKEFETIIVYDYKLGGKAYNSYYRSPDGIYTVKYGDLWGVLGSDGNWVYDFDYDYISPISEDGMIAVKKNGECYLIDDDGIVQKYIDEFGENMYSWGDGYIPVKTEKGYQYLNVESGKLSNEAYAYASSYQRSKAVVCIGDCWRMMSTDMQMIEDSSFDNVKLYPNGDYSYHSVMVAFANGKYGLYNQEGKADVTVECKDMDNYYGDYIAYQDNNGLWGYIDIKGNIVIEPQYKEARSFSNGLASVFNGEKWGYIDHDDDLVIACQFTTPDYFTSGGIAMVSSDGTTYQILKLRF